MKKVVAIVGPTATGKTNLAIFLKDKLNDISLINGDSVQVYKGLDIGSDKIDKTLQKKYPHKLLDKISLDCDYSVYDYQKDVRKIIKKSTYPLIVGGSGFYIKSVLYDYKFSPNLKRDSTCEILKKDLDYKVNYIKEKDPNCVIDFLNERKVDRTFMKILNGDTPSLNQNENVKVYDQLIIYLDLERNYLKDKIIKRIKDQLSNNFLAEVKSLIKYKDKLKNILGYKQMLDLIDNKISEDEYINLVLNNTMQLAKKQKTWFKNKMDIKVYDAKSDTLYEDVLKDVKEFFKI